MNYDWRRDPPPPFVAGLDEDSAGILRVLLHVAGTNWREGFPVVPDSVGEVPEYRMRLSKLRASLVEFIDPKAATVIARHRFDSYVLSLLPNGRLAVYAEDEHRNYHVVIVSISLDR